MLITPYLASGVINYSSTQEVQGPYEDEGVPMYMYV